MNKLELSPDGYERIMEKVQAIESALKKGIFKPGTAPRRLREALGELQELRIVLDETLVLAPDIAGPPGPDAA